MGKEEKRMMESQDFLREVMAEALGIYMAKEPAEKDGWREKTIFQNVQHAAHEIEEIKRSTTLDRKYHNCLDLIGQAAICAAQVRIEWQKQKEASAE